MFRFRLRTLLIVLAILPPLCAWLWTNPEWERYQRAKANVDSRKSELARAKALPAGTRKSKAALRHAELRLKRDDAYARETSVLYRILAAENKD
jgi:hypothetical protein